MCTGVVNAGARSGSGSPLLQCYLFWQSVSAVSCHVLGCERAIFCSFFVGFRENASFKLGQVERLLELTLKFYGSN